MRRRGQQAPERDAGVGQAHKEEGKGQDDTSRVSNRIQKIGKSAEQSEGSSKAGTNRHQQLTYTSDRVASSAVPISSSRTLTREGKGHGGGRAAENQGPKTTRGGKKIHEWSAEVQEPNGNIWKGQQPNADRTPRSDTGRKTTDPYRQEGQHSHNHHNTTQQNKQQQGQGLPVKVQRLSFFYTCQKKKSGDSFVVLDLWDSCPRHTRRR